MRGKQTLMRAVSHTRRVWSQYMRQIAQDVGIPDSYRPVIMFVHRNPGAGQRSIADFHGTTTSAINQTVQSMVAEGYLRKESDPADKRSYKLYLTDRGEELAHRVHERIDAADEAITAYVSQEKENELIAFLDELTEFIRRDLGQC